MLKDPLTYFDELFVRDSQEERWIAKLPQPISHFLGYRKPNVKYVSYIPLVNRLPPELERLIWGFIGGFIGITLIIAVFSNSNTLLNWQPPFIVASYGASSVLAFGSFESPLAQPRNIVFGHFFSALVGVIYARLFSFNDGYNPSNNAIGTAFEVGQLAWFAAALATATAIATMQLTKTVHPPAGATALIATTMPSLVQLSWKYLATVLISSLLMVGWALIWNNLGNRKYPTYWVTPDKN